MLLHGASGHRQWRPAVPGQAVQPVLQPERASQTAGLPGPAAAAPEDVPACAVCRQTGAPQTQTDALLAGADLPCGHAEQPGCGQVPAFGPVLARVVVKQARVNGLGAAEPGQTRDALRVPGQAQCGRSGDHHEHRRHRGDFEGGGVRDQEKGGEQRGVHD